MQAVGQALRRALVPGLVAAIGAAVVAAGIGRAAAGEPAAPCAAADPGAPFEPTFESVGAGVIPRDVVATMAQDGAGFLWIATGDGLVRYDGYRFRPQERDDADPGARNLGWIRALLATRDGHLWIGTETDGLARYDAASGRIAAWPAARPSGAPPLPTVRALAEDVDGTIWVGTSGGGLQHADPRSAVVRTFRAGAAPGDLPDDRVQALHVDRDGVLWVGTWRGLARRLPGGTAFDAVWPAAGAAEGTDEHTVQAIFETADGRLWVGTRRGGLLRVDRARAVSERLEPAGGSAAPASVTAFAQATDGGVWVGTDAGLECRDPADGRVLRHVRHDPRRRGALAGQEVTTLLRDRAGWIWVGGLGIGLQRHNPVNRSIWVRSADAPGAGPFDDANVRSLLVRDDGEIWAGLPGGTIAVLDRRLRGTASLRLPPAVGAAAPQAMAQGADGTVWVAVDSVLHRFDRERRLVRTLRHDGGPTHRLFVGRDGALWIAAEDGLRRVRAGGDAVERVARGDGTVGAAFAVAEAADGALWDGTATGLYRLPAGADVLEPVPSPAGGGLGNPVVIGLLFDRQGTLWVDTAVAGLHRMMQWDGAAARFDGVSRRHGVVGRPYGANLLEDERGRIWTQQYVYDPAADRLDELTTADGKDFGMGWFFSFARTADGRFLFGGTRGVLVVHPQAYEPSSYAPALVVSELRIDGVRESVGPVPAELRVPPGRRSLSVEFAALDYSDPARIRYAWRLEGRDAGWRESGADDRIATYGPLAPGAYVLRVRATNRSGVWSAQELALPVRVEPAWWQRTPVQAAAAGGGALLVWGLVHWRTRQLRASRQRLEGEVRARTAELEALARRLRDESATLQESSLTDPLTGLRNRRFLMERVAADAALALRHHARPAGAGGDADLVFVLVDIDHFKRINDTHGHAAGDAVLRQMRERLQCVLRASDYAVRWGGEEFLLVVRETSRTAAHVLAERVRQSVAAEPFVVDGGLALHCTCSIGFACFPLAPAQPQVFDWNDAINLADAALYASKQRGRNAWSGVVGVSGDAQALRRHGTAADWLASSRLEVEHS